MPHVLEGDLNGAGHKYGIVVSRFNDFITGRLVDGAVDCLVRHGVQDGDIDVVRVPGAFEIPMGARKLVARNKYDAVLCLGAVIRGGTPHFEFVAGEASKGVGALALEAAIPVLFGVLTTNTIEQAVERAGVKSGNKGWETAMAAIEMVNLYRQM
ncbi:6,7-dimethyl-8-ribityllumazine synthase [Nitrospina watsonii]|uniref:6,7-dimethyl-8-ribityllumazine synthase n=1 Tax=Nitrospina watsonii TaxID=1323948 RepID=A0ABM9HCN0_9BACT|nr:6,7-dimethyl-8-ribityllumazine synthase [Nitrospina watsonii]CAI2718004.1 6,7-dimethyl-8-ribityllumazine synthase [Nitrospina watsonii]